jgi:two-component sensor histidine kinase
MAGTGSEATRSGGAAVLEHSAAASNGLVDALHHTGVSVLYQDCDLRLLWAQNLPAGWVAAGRPGATDADFLPAPAADLVIAAKRSVLANLAPGRIEIDIDEAGGSHWFDLWIDADCGADGVPRGVFTTAVDITERKRREQTLTALLREVSHRSKNLLAIIQSIATQTGRHSTDIDSFLTRFRGRLQSLASSQDLVTSSNWRGADLHELVFGQVGRYAISPQRAVRFAGERPWLNPNAALHVGLALHELAVNSVSYGALSRLDGVVDVSADVVAGPPGEKALAITWSEATGSLGGGAADQATRHKRFGSAALERIVPASLNGVASLDIGADRVEYRLAIPFGSFEAE